MHPLAWRLPSPRKLPLSPAVSQIVTQDYCEAMQQLELEQDLRLHAEAFAHEVLLALGHPAHGCWAGGEETGTHGGWESGAGLVALSVPWCKHPNPYPTTESQEDGDAPGHPSRSPGMRSDGFCSQPPQKGFFSLWGEPGGSLPP